MRKVIFINGPPNSGKSTAIKFIIEALMPLQGMHPKELIPSIRGKMAVMALLGLPTSDWSRYEQIKDEKSPKFFGRSPREWYIGLMEGMKDWYGQDLFGALMAREIDNLVQPNVFIYDAGFSQEIAPIVNKVGKGNCCILQIARPDCSFAGDSRQYIDGSDVPASRVILIKNKYDLDLYRAQVLNAIAPMFQFEQGWFEQDNMEAWSDDEDEEGVT